jgi:hypothetical protein
MFVCVCVCVCHAGDAGGYAAPKTRDIADVIGRHEEGDGGTEGQTEVDDL